MDQQAVDYCQERGWKTYYEEWTDAIGHLPCDMLGPMVYIVRDEHLCIMGYSQVSRYRAELDAYENACQAAQEIAQMSPEEYSPPLTNED